MEKHDELFGCSEEIIRKVEKLAGAFIRIDKDPEIVVKVLAHALGGIVTAHGVSDNVIMNEFTNARKLYQSFMRSKKIQN